MADVRKSNDSQEKNPKPRASDAAVESGVISDQTNQDAHSTVHQASHANDKNLTDPEMIALKDGETPEEHNARVAKIQANRFGLYDSSLEPKGRTEGQTLIAQSLDEGRKLNPPYGFGDDGRWHFQNPRVRPGQDIAGAMKEWLWNDMPNLPRHAVNNSWALSEPLLKGLNEWMQRKPELTYMEYLTGIQNERGESPWKDVSFEGVDKAFSKFPKLAKHALPKEFIAGVILNETLHGGDIRDVGEELSVKIFGTVRNWNGQENNTASVGPAQIQIRNIRHLVEKYPELSIFKDDPIRAASNPETAPMFVAAYISDKIDLIEKYNRERPNEHIPINQATIAYLYNPDVISADGTYRQIDSFDKISAALHIDTRKGWKTETMPNNDEIVRRSKVIQDILNATKACYR